MSDFSGKICLIVDINDSNDVLVLNPQMTQMGSFDASEVHSFFRAKVTEGYIMPPDIDILEELAYIAKCNGRKGGYNKFCKHLVIGHSLHKGKFTDSCLFQ